MTNPVNSFQTNFGRFYSHPKVSLGVYNAAGDYQPNPSVTNIIGMINKAFLPPYYAKLVAEYAVKNVDSITYWLEKFGETAAIGNLKSVINRPNPNAAIGDEIHEAIDQYCKGVDPRETVTALGLSRTAENMFRQWQNFAANHPFRIVRSEFTVWSYSHGFAGTGDLMLETDDGLGILDTKSGNQLYPEVALQTTALSHADVILDANGTECPMPPIDWQGAIHIRPRSLKLYRLDKTDEAWETFLAAKRIFDWKRFDAPMVMSTQPVIYQKPKDGE